MTSTLRQLERRNRTDKLAKNIEEQVTIPSTPEGRTGRTILTRNSSTITLLPRLCQHRVEGRRRQLRTLVKLEMDIAREIEILQTTETIITVQRSTARIQDITSNNVPPTSESPTGGQVVSITTSVNSLTEKGTMNITELDQLIRSLSLTIVRIMGELV